VGGQRTRRHHAQLARRNLSGDDAAVAPVSPGRRQLESSALTALLPLFAVVPIWLLAMLVVWWPLHLVWDVHYWWLAGGYLAAGVLLFLRPVQRLVLAPLLGARRPTRDERAQLDISWRSVLQANGLPRGRYVLAVQPADELNAYACGGHLVIVTTYALDELPRDELMGVMAHELSHHLGLHTVPLTISQWLSVPVLVLARIGFFLQNVARAATDSFASESAAITAIGSLIAFVLRTVSWAFLAGLVLVNTMANVAGRKAELQADQRVITMGFGRPLARALRRVINDGLSDRPESWRDRLAATHPPARTRVARIEAELRAKHAAAGVR
jgi:Zn-dependent protease with chaperone function